MIRSDSTSILEDFEQIVNSSTASRDETHSDAEFQIDDELQALNVTVTKEKSLGELIAGLEERLLSVITRNHEETTSRITLLESRMEEKLKAVESMMAATDEHRTEEMAKLTALKEESKESKKALLSELKAQVGDLKGLHRAEIDQLAKPNGERTDKKKKASKKCACLAARKGAVECLGKIKSRCMKPFVKSSTGGVVAADGAVTTDAGEASGLHSLVLTNRKACRVAFRAEGSKEARRWFVAGITEPPPCSLRVGDEIVTIGGVAVAGVSLEKIKEMVGAIQETGNVQVRRDTAETQA